MKLLRQSFFVAQLVYYFDRLILKQVNAESKLAVRCWN